MSNIFLVPTWFFGFDVVMEVLFAIITLWVSSLAYNAYQLSEKRQFKLFSLGFLFIGISYIIQSIFNAVIVFKLNQEICDVVKYMTLNTLNYIAFSFFMVSFIIGLVTLTYALLKTKNIGIFGLLCLISITSIVFSYHIYLMTYLISSLLLGFIVFTYFQEYRKVKKNNVLLVFVAFLFLFLSKILYLASFSNGIAYVFGHFLELTAYLFILINLYLALRK